MSASRNVVERFLSLVRRRRFDRLAEVLDDEFVMIAPDTPRRLQIDRLRTAGVAASDEMCRTD
jgi:hypothetical protein